MLSMFADIQKILICSKVFAIRIGHRCSDLLKCVQKVKESLYNYNKLFEMTIFIHQHNLNALKQNFLSSLQK